MFLRKLSVFIIAILFAESVLAGVIFGSDGNLGGGYRWDAALYQISDGQGGQLERSLQGGLRYSVQGGSMLNYRDSFQWSTTPSVSDFEAAITQAFNAWTIADPVTGLTTDLFFVNDTNNTQVVGNGFGTVNILGAEIDLLASDAGDASTRATSFFNASLATTTTLTSGTANYAPGAITGADINMNNNVGATYNLDIFTRLLTHEIGHAIGLGDVEDYRNNGFIDDNFDPNDPLGTLTNSWAMLVDPFNPAGSVGLTQFFNVSVADVKVPGVDILMESEGLGIGTNNPLSNLFPLTNDEFGMRQFLYPTLARAVSEPGMAFLLLAGLSLLRIKRNSL